MYDLKTQVIALQCVCKRERACFSRIAYRGARQRCSKPQDSLDLVILFPVTVYNEPLITPPEAWHGGVVDWRCFIVVAWLSFEAFLENKQRQTMNNARVKESIWREVLTKHFLPLVRGCKSPALALRHEYRLVRLYLVTALR